MTESTRGNSALGGLNGIMAGLEDLYRDVHEHPELSMQEHRQLRQGGGAPRGRRL
jgi:hypothetical protein